MAPKSQPQKSERKRQRVRPTNKGLEAMQFSTVRPSSLAHADALPATSSAASPRLLQHLMSDSSQRSPAPTSKSETFDPIQNDPVLVVVPNSTYWPPPSLEELQERSGVKVSGSDGLDLYDRREEEAEAKRAKAAAMKEERRKGELQHPRGKPRKNVVEKLDSSSCSGDDDEEN